MTADRSGSEESGAGAQPGGPRDMPVADMTRGGIAASAALHVVVAALVVLGLPDLFRKPPPQEMPIAVQLVAIAPETRATQPNPFRPRPDAKPEPPRAEPAPIPEPKPEPPTPGPPPPSAAAAPAPPPPPPPPKSEAKPAPQPAASPPSPKVEAKPAPKPAPPPPKPEAKPAPPPPKPVETRAPAAPPPVPERKPAPKPEPKPVQHARAEPRPESRPKPEPPRASRTEPKPEPRPEAGKVDPAAFGKLLQDLEARDKKDQPDAFDSLLRNLTRQQTVRSEEPTPTRRMAALSPPSAQPQAPLGTELTASEIDVVRQQLSRCWNIPAGARDARDLVVTIRGTIAPDGRVLQADIVDRARMSDPFFRAAAESARRAFFHPHCTPLRLPPEKYNLWKTFEIALSPKDIL